MGPRRRSERIDSSTFKMRTCTFREKCTADPGATPEIGQIQGVHFGFLAPLNFGPKPPLNRILEKGGFSARPRSGPRPGPDGPPGGLSRPWCHKLARPGVPI